MPQFSSTQTVLFYRDFQGLTGGHLKYWDYFNHILYSRQYFPYIYFSQKTLWNIHNPWLYLKHHQHILPQGQLIQPNFLFIEGVDWLIAQKYFAIDQKLPIINLIQHIRHADPSNIRYQFLKNKAIRICVSEEVKIALEESNQVNGPIFSIPCGLDTLKFPKPIIEKTQDLCIAALKEPNLGFQLKKALTQPDRRVELLTHQISRSEFLHRINQSRVTLFLPDRQAGEGFYLPALEGMALKTIVVCPDCIGNRSFCLPNENCIRPEYHLDSLIEAVNQALQLPDNQHRYMLEKAMKTASEYSLRRERRSFLEILENVNNIW